VIIAPRFLHLDLDDPCGRWARSSLAAEASLLSLSARAPPRGCAAYRRFDAHLRAGVAERFRRKATTSRSCAAKRSRRCSRRRISRWAPAADDAFEIFVMERNRVELYADVLFLRLRALRAKYRLFFNLRTATPISSGCGIAELFDGTSPRRPRVPAQARARIFCSACARSGRLEICTWATIPW